MANSLYNIFGDHHLNKTTKQNSLKIVGCQPFSNNENIKSAIVQTGPYKANQPTKEGVKKSFFSNTGKALQSTPARQPFTPRAVNMGGLIYSDTDNDHDFKIEHYEFTKPSKECDHFYKNLHDCMEIPMSEFVEQSPPSTPPPLFKRPSFEFDDTYHDDFFTDDFSNNSFNDSDMWMPKF